MLAVLSREAGGPASLELAEVERPHPGPGQLLIRTAAVSLNFLDCLVIEDRYQARPSRPFSPGCELSGAISALGAGVQGFRPGDRVVATTDFGALAEFVVADCARAFVVPPDMPFHIGAAMLVTYGTAMHALQDRARLAAGDTVLVLGASGGAGIAAIQLGKAQGARVVAAVSSERKAEVARAAGADEAIIYPLPPLDREASQALASRFKEAVGAGGANVVYDPVGGDYCEPALRALAWHGCYLVIGFAAGIPRVPLNLALLKECEVSGVFWGEYVKRHPQHFERQFRELMELWRTRMIQPQILARFPLDRAGEAMALIRDREAMGKIIVDVVP